MPTQTGSIDFTSTGGFKSYATNKYATQSTVSGMQTAISQNATDISLQASRLETNDGNILYDTDQPSLTKVNGPANRYWSDSGNASVTCSLVSLSDPPRPGIGYAARFVNDGTNTATVRRAITFYNLTGNALGLVAGQSYTASWFARCTSGSGGTQINYRYDNDGTPASRGIGVVDAVTSEWKQYTATFTIETLASDYTRIWFYSRFLANTAGTVELCDFKLRPSTYATSAELKVTNDAVSSKVSTTDYNGTTIASLINQSADTVQIQAQHIQLDGDVTFGVIKDYADAAYDALGAADAVQVGGRNLLQRGWRERNDRATKSGVTFVCNPDGSVTVDGTNSNTSAVTFRLASSVTLDAGDYTLSGCPSGGGLDTYRLDILLVPVSSTSNESVADNGDGITFTTIGGATGEARIRVAAGATASNLTFWPKLERGNRVTDWSLSPEDQAAAVYQSAQPNLSPFFSNEVSDKDYWFTTANLIAYTSNIGDGWASFSENSLNINVSPKVDVMSHIKASTTYTVLLEVANSTIVGSVTFYAYTATNSMIAATASVPIKDDGTYRLLVTTKDDPFADGITHFRLFLNASASGASFSGDVRLSLYEGSYYEPYKPMYATSTDISGINVRLDSADESISSLQNDMAEVSETQSWMRFVKTGPDSGLYIGDNQGDFRTKINSESMEFLSGDVTLATASGTVFDAPTMKSGELHLGDDEHDDWMWTIRKNRNLSLKWIGTI